MGNEKQALVTGASGFIGSHLVETLRREGWSVRCLIRRSSSRKMLPHQGVELAFGELENRDSLSRALRGITTVFHLAGRVSARRRRDFFEVNLEGTKNLLTAARTEGGLKRFIYASSLSAAGPSPDGHPRRETEEARPVSYYGESKLAAEGEVLRAGVHFPVTILRPAAVYGPGDQATLQLIRMAARGWRFQPGGADSTFSAIHVGDVVAGMILAAGEPETRSATYYLADGRVYSWGETFTLLQSLLGRKTGGRRIPWASGRAAVRLAAAVCPLSPAAFYLDKIREMDHKYWVCDISQAREALGFSPRYDLPRGLQETIEWYRTAGWL